MTSQSSVESTGTITQEHILMSMRQGVEDKIRQKLSEEFTLKQAIIQSLRETQDGLNKGQTQLRHAIGKKCALKKYDEFIRNTSCFCTMCDFHKKTFFAISKMAKTQFLHQKKV